MSGVSDAKLPCFICGYVIAPDDFEEWRGAGKARFAICGYCGAVNQQHDTVFVVLDRRPAAPVSHAVEAPPSNMDVYALIGGGWRACCDCGLTEAVGTQAAGWSWVLDHQCMAWQ
jgi:hypothetical protein